MKRKLLSVLLALVLALSLCLVTAVPVAAQVTINVPADYGTIQLAIDNASSGDTIIVSDGIYPEDLTVNIADVTLKSETGEANTTIQLVDLVGIDIQAGATNFTLGGASGQGFTILSGSTTTFNIQVVSAPFGVTISHNTIDTTGNASQGISIGAAGASGLAISSNTFTAEAGDGSIWGPKVVNITVSTNTFTGPGSTTSGYAVEFAGVTGTSVVSSNNISGYGMAVAIFNGEGTSGLTISSNTISGCENGIRLGQYSPSTNGDMTTVTVTRNTLSTNAIAIRVGDGANVMASNFLIENNNITGSTPWGLQNEHSTETVDATSNWWGITDGSAIATMISGGVDYSPWWGESYLTGTAPDILLVDHPWTWYTNDSIQDAIDNADPFDTVIVAAGTYSEKHEAPSAGIIIDKSLTLLGANAGVNARGRTGSESIIDAQLADFAVHIKGVGTIATFDGFTVNNYETGGILAGAFNPAWGPVPDEVDILNNVVEAPSPLVDAHNNNIQVGNGVTGTIIGNEVSGAWLFSPDWSGSGILVASSNDIVISENYVHDCEGGIQIAGYAGAYGFFLPAVANVIEYNLVENCETGISVQMNSQGTIVRYNDVLNNNGVGIGSVGYIDQPLKGIPSGTQIHYNNIDGNGNYGVRSSVWDGEADEGEEVDARYNWWGDPSGPDGAQVFVPGEPGTYTGVLPGKGNNVSANVKCKPWLTREFQTVLGDDIAYFGISAPALKGWNIVSAPLALDAHVTAGGFAANTWGGLQYLGKIAEDDDYALKLHYTEDGDGERTYSPIYYYVSDSASPDKGWQPATVDTKINPLDAFYIRMMESDSIPILFSPNRSVPSKELYKGWNLVGCAYMDVMFGGEGGLALETALATIKSVSSQTGDVIGYDQVVSPSMNQPSWTFIPPNIYTPTQVKQDTILIGKGYWVFMENPGTLAGLTFTPISPPKP